ncbi:hypothetical protein MIND_01360300 [Mycena indigotica]|uniref:Uncharacterized protein n=1 Tax=Mycena indigotica TaxID=2126181 RepID=A0A8H6VQD5_9AGAR|nr:uncharacterized protein MIND_01360300 [Mycena indigotica]KAF7289859.1 hypothetical protein MIND_01360300 [Mycena indigotica]
MYKIFVLLSIVTILAESSLAAPLEARRGRGGKGRGKGAAQANSATGNLVQCTSFDQSAAAFSNGDGPDVKLPPCSTIIAPKVPFSCTNIQAVANAFGTALCNTIGNASGAQTVATPPEAAPAPPAEAAAGATAGAKGATQNTAPVTKGGAAPTKSTTQSASQDNRPIRDNTSPPSITIGNLVQCTSFDQSAAAFSSPDGPDLGISQCSSIKAPKVPFNCTNIQAVANAFGTTLCNTIAAAAALDAPGVATPIPCTDSTDGLDNKILPDIGLPQCKTVVAPQIPFSCTTSELADLLGLPSCNDAGKASTPATR